jgi:3-oxoacyl-[acyl-carrier-protein] synthase-3
MLATASYLPERWMDAEELGALTGITPEVIVERFGLRGKHVASRDEHASDLAVKAGRRLLEEQALDPRELDAVVYCGSTWKDYAVWQAAPHIAHRLGARRAFALELDYVSCGAPVALRVCRGLLGAEEGWETVLLLAASRESHLLDYANPRARFMINFGDGAAATLLVAGERRNELLGWAGMTDGSYSLDVKVPAGGSVEPPSCDTVAAGRHSLDVQDPIAMKARLDPVTLPNFLSVARSALRASRLEASELGYLCPIHVKRSLHQALLDGLGLPLRRSSYLDDTGHMSGVDPLLGFDRASRAGLVADGEIVLLLAAGTGYTWAASALRAGSPRR